MSKKITRNQVKKLAKTVNEKLIIDGLWRDPLWLYNETMLSATSAEKADAQSELYDQHYVYLENSFIDETGIDVSYATAVGFGNVLKADFSHVTGYGNETTSFCETIIGPYGFIPLDQIKDAWVITDRLFTVANGTGTNAEQRHDALNIYKSGYIEAYNALTLGLYSHGENIAGDGTIQYNPETGLEFRHLGEWVVVGGSGDIRKTFISLDDTMDSYLELGVSTRGWGMVVSPFSDSVISAKAFGITSAPQFYIRHCCPAFIAGDNIISNGDFISNLNGWIVGINWAWYNGVAAHAPGSTEPIKQELTGIDNRAMKATFTVIVNAGSLTVSVTNRESFQITESGTFSRYFTGSVHVPAYITFTPSSDFDGQIDDVELIPESSSSMGDAPLLLKDISNNTVQEIKWPGNNLLIGNNIANQLTSGASGNMICAPGSLVNLQTGSNITAIGHSLGATVVTSSGHVLLGYGVDVPDDNNDGYMVIGNGVTDFIRGYAANIEIAGGLKINADSSTAWIQFPVTAATKFNSILLGGSTSETLGNLAWSPYSMPASAPLIDESVMLFAINGTVVWSTLPTGMPDGNVGDILYYNSGWQKLAKGSDGQYLKLSSGLPFWASISIPTSQWLNDSNGITYGSSGSNVGIGVASANWVKLSVYVDGSNKAIYGYSTGSYGVFGKSDTSVGVYAEGVTAGVSAISTNGQGGEFNSTNNYGIYASSVNNYAAYFPSTAGILVKKISVGIAGTGGIAYVLPVVDGNESQVLQTNGAGGVSWATISNVPAPGGIGRILISNTSSAMQWLGTGANNQLLKCQGSGAIPQWTSIKTINGTSIIGTGDIAVGGSKWTTGNYGIYYSGHVGVGGIADAGFTFAVTGSAFAGELVCNTAQVTNAANGTFTTVNGKTVTVTYGIVTNIV